jgi:hypothetical protein
MFFEKDKFLLHAASQSEEIGQTFKKLFECLFFNVDVMRDVVSLNTLSMHIIFIWHWILDVGIMHDVGSTCSLAHWHCEPLDESYPHMTQLQQSRFST